MGVTSHRLAHALAAFLLAAIFSASAVKTGSAAGDPPRFSRASALIGTSVVNRHGEQLGELSELILDLRTGRAHAAVLESGDKQYAFHAWRLAPGGDKLVLNAETIERERDAAAGASAPPSLIRASELIGSEVKDKRGQAAGEVKDVVVNLVDGRIRHYVVEREGRQAKVQPKWLSLSRTGEPVLDISLKELRARRAKALDR